MSDQPLALDLAVAVGHANDVLLLLAVLVGEDAALDAVRVAQPAVRRDPKIADLELGRPREGGEELLDNPLLLRGEGRASALARPLGGSVLTAAFRRGQAERQGGFLQGQAS